MLTYCSSDHKIGSTISSGGANEDYVVGGHGHGDQVLGLEKKKEKNKKLKAKVISIGAFWFGDQNT